MAQTFFEKWKQRIRDAWLLLLGKAWIGFGNPMDWEYVGSLRMTEGELIRDLEKTYGLPPEVGESAHTAPDAIRELRALAKELSNALISIRPLGGSELFRRVGDDFYADADYCKLLIQEQSAYLDEARKDNIRLTREVARLRQEIEKPAK